MSAFLLAIAPIITIVAIGRFLGWRAIIPPEGFRAIERLAYILLFPALIVLSLANAPFETAPWKLALALIGGQLCLALLGLVSKLASNVTRPAAGSIIQSNVRWNTFVALSLGSTLFGDEGLALVAIAAAAMIPTANVISVWGLTAHADRPSEQSSNVLATLLRNPLIIACVIGGAIAVSGITLPEMATDTLRILGQATIALGLLSAGAGVDIAALKRAGHRTALWSLVRLLGLPLAVLAIAVLIGLTGTPLAIAVICASVPTATNGYILARELGGDGVFSANLIAVQTVLAAITMPLIWFGCISLGLI